MVHCEKHQIKLNITVQKNRNMKNILLLFTVLLFFSNFSFSQSQDCKKTIRAYNKLMKKENTYYSAVGIEVLENLLVCGDPHLTLDNLTNEQEIERTRYYAANHGLGQVYFSLARKHKNNYSEGDRAYKKSLEHTAAGIDFVKQSVGFKYLTQPPSVTSDWIECVVRFWYAEFQERHNKYAYDDYLIAWNISEKLLATSVLTHEGMTEIKDINKKVSKIKAKKEKEEFYADYKKAKNCYENMGESCHLLIPADIVKLNGLVREMKGLIVKRYSKELKANNFEILYSKIHIKTQFTEREIREKLNQVKIIFDPAELKFLTSSRVYIGQNVKGFSSFIKMNTTTLEYYLGSDTHQLEQLTKVVEKFGTSYSLSEFIELQIPFTEMEFLGEGEMFQSSDLSGNGLTITKRLEVPFNYKCRNLTKDEDKQIIKIIREVFPSVKGHNYKPPMIIDDYITCSANMSVGIQDVSSLKILGYKMLENWANSSSSSSSSIINNSDLASKGNSDSTSPCYGAITTEFKDILACSPVKDGKTQVYGVKCGDGKKRKFYYCDVHRTSYNRNDDGYYYSFTGALGADKKLSKDKTEALEELCNCNN